MKKIIEIDVINSEKIENILQQNNIEYDIHTPIDSGDITIVIDSDELEKITYPIILDIMEFKEQYELIPTQNEWNIIKENFDILQFYHFV